MTPRRTQAEQPMNEWEDLRRTILTMQENLQEMIHASFRELAETM